MARSSAPTSRDVARLAGVDRSTVSIVLNDPHTSRITEATKQRVLDAVESLGYAPSAAASQLRSGASRLFLMPFPSLPFGPTYDRLVQGLSDGCDESGYVLLIHGSRRTRGAEGAAEWARWRPEVFFADASQLDQAAVTVLRAAGARVLVTLGDAGLEGVSPIDFGADRVGRIAAARLLQRDIDELVAVVPTDPALEPLATARVTGFREGAAGRDIRVVRLGSDDAGLDRWLVAHASGRSRAGVFAFNDALALRLVAAARRAGIDVPGALAVVGVDDIEAARLTDPPLTTIRYDPYVFGRAVVAAAVGAADGQAPAMPRPDYHLVARSSG